MQNSSISLAHSAVPGPFVSSHTFGKPPIRAAYLRYISEVFHSFSSFVLKYSAILLLMVFWS